MTKLFLLRLNGDQPLTHPLRAAANRASKQLKQKLKFGVHGVGDILSFLIRRSFL
jgi:hypothetical protein